jgi:acetolactate synthase-1/2/3 large subunit
MSSSRLAAVEPTVAHAILQILEGEGVEYVFGVPGGPLTSFFEALHARKTIRFVLAKHEGAAAFMAAAYARVSGRIGVCCVTSGPGATNALTGIASAFSDGLPVLLLTGQVATHVFGKGAIQESSVHGVDVVEIFRPVTLQSTMLPTVARVADLVRGAIRLAMTGRRGPVHLSLPADFLAKPTACPALGIEQYRTLSSPVDAAAIANAARLLRSAKRPCILAGHGVALAGGYQELKTLARTHRIPVATSPKGKGVFPEQDPLSLGVLGFGGHQLAEQYLESGEVDVLLVVGSSLNEFVTNGWTVPIGRQQKLVHLDIDPGVIGRNYPTDLGIVGDARASLQQLDAALRELGQANERELEPLAALRARTPRYLAAESIDSDALPLKPQRLMAELRAAMPDDGMLFVDNGTSIIWATHYFEAREPSTYFIDLGLAAMGSAVAGVIGGALAARHRRAVALVGDAAFAMHGMEVHTAVELGLPVVWLVLNNGGHGMVYQGETLMKGGTFGTSIFKTPIDSAALGAALGAHAARVDSASGLRQALDEALAANGPTVIDALIDPNEMAPTLMKRAQTLAQFFALRRKTDPPETLHPSPGPLSVPPVTLAPMPRSSTKPPKG